MKFTGVRLSFVFPLVITLFSVFILQGCANMHDNYDDDEYDYDYQTSENYSFKNSQGEKISVSKENADVYNNGLQFHKNRQYDQAIAKFTEAIELFPKVA